LINSNFTLFIPYLKCDIPFYVEYSDYLYYLHCWENGVLQKATKSAHEKIDLVNQQLPKPTQQNDPEPTSIQTQTQAQAQDKTIPESVNETVVEESVPVTKSEPSVSVPDSEPVQNLTLIASNQPSSPSHIQILEQPPINILES